LALPQRAVRGRDLRRSTAHHLATARATHESPRAVAHLVGHALGGRGLKPVDQLKPRELRGAPFLGDTGVVLEDLGALTTDQPE